MKWINIHIPKCSGTTFTAILKANFGASFGAARGYLSDRDFKYSSDQVSQILQHFPRLQCISDHKMSVKLPWNEFPITAIAFVRNPVDRYLSHYFYCRDQAQFGLVFDREAATLELDNYITETLEINKKNDLHNGQCYHIFGDNDTYDFSILKKMLEDNRLLLFPVDSFEDVCIYLEKKYPDSFRDTSYLLINASKNKNKVSNDQRYRIMEYMSQDIELHELSKKWFEMSFYSLFLSDEERQSSRNDLVKRCNKLSKSLSSPFRRLRKIVAAKIEPVDRVSYFHLY